MGDLVMCIGLPMRVIEPGDFWARCEGLGESAVIDMSLVGPQPAGVWVLTFLGAARELLDPIEAAKICDALTFVQMAAHGKTPPDHLIADLINREPTLPDFLRQAAATSQGALSEHVPSIDPEPDRPSGIQSGRGDDAASAGGL